MSNNPHDTQLERSAEPQPKSWVCRNRGWLAVAMLIAVGLALGWDWFAASGLLGIILVLLACAVMCVVGMRGGSAHNRDG